MTHDGQTDVWGYSISPTTIHSASITAPDGGVTSETLNVNGYAFKTVYPDGSELDRAWTQNISNLNTTAVIPNQSSDSPNQLPVVNPFVSLEFHTITNSSGSQVNTSVKQFSVDLNGNQLSESEYDYVATSSLQRDSIANVPNAAPSASPLRTTANSYYFAGSCYCSSSAAPGILDLVQTTQLSGTGSGAGPGSFAAFCYDNLSATGTNSGNVKTEAHWDSTLGSTSGISMSCPTISGPVSLFTYSYDTYGNRTSSTDADTNPTSYTYGNIGGQSSLYPTTVTYADGETITRTYDLSTAAVLTQTDPNNVTTSTTGDPFGRPANIVTVNRTTNVTYVDTPSGPPSITSKSDLNSHNDQTLVSTRAYDQLGRVNQTTSSAPNNNIQTQTAYFAGTSSTPNYHVTSNPFQTTSDPTMGWTCSQLDRLGRVVAVQTFSGATQPTSCSGSGFGTIATVYSASSSAPLTATTTVTDEAGKTRISAFDGLGRLVGVTEDPSTLHYTTTYSYDALDDLTGVSQNGQARTFAYDSLKRLSSATNPESGQTTYTYDHNGNLLTKTDARGAVTTNQYDSRNRIITKSYTVPSGVATTPNVTYSYGAPGGVQYSVGRLTSVAAASTTSYSYDQYGDVVSSTQTTNSTPYIFSPYTYNLVGGLQSIAYPSGRVVSYTFDSAGRVNTVTGVLGAATTNYTQAGTTISYAPQGAISGMTLGNGLAESTQFNGKLQPTQIQAGSLLTLNYVFPSSGNNGNLQSQQIIRGSFNVTQSYTGYDGVNRLVTTSESGSASWSEGEVYDAFGNRSVCAYSGLPAPTAETPQSTSCQTSSSFTSGNQINGWTYDAAGNLQSIPSMRSSTYDAENRQATATISGETTNYVYDGDGRRVEKITPSGTTVFVYDAAGQLAAEYGQATDSGTTYVTADHLGSTRLTTDATGNVKTCYDYLPFGGDLKAGLNGRPSCYPGASVYPQPADILSEKFTSKERDSETGLDFFGARYMSSAQGRFTSPDWSATPEPIPYANLNDPQTLNLYAYVRNNPLSGRDLDGHAEIQIRYNSIGPGYTHSYIVVTDRNGTQTYFRGGPSAGGPSSGSSGALSSGSGGSSSQGSSSRGSSSQGSSSGSSGSNSSNSSSPGSGPGGAGADSGPFGRIEAVSGPYVPGTVDYSTSPAASVTLLSNDQPASNYTGQLSQYQDAVNKANIPYNPFTTNSNAYAVGAANSLGLTVPKPPVLAPGRGTTLPVTAPPPPPKPPAPPPCSVQGAC